MVTETQYSAQSTEYTTLLEVSNTLYSSMLQVLNTLGESPETVSVTLFQNRLAQFHELQQQIAENDSKLTPLLTVQPEENPLTRKLLEQRRQILELVFANNKKVKLQAQAIRSLLNDEIKKSKKGHTALQGYRQSESYQSSGTFKRAM